MWLWPIVGYRILINGYTQERLAVFLDPVQGSPSLSKDFATPKVADRFYTLVNPNQDVYKATYVFLPIVVKDGIPMIEWKDEWKLENYE